MARGRKRVNIGESLQVIRRDPKKIKQYNTYIKTLAAYFQRIDDANAGLKDTLKNAAKDLGLPGGYLRKVTRQGMAGAKDFLVADVEVLVEGIELAEGETVVEEDGYEVEETPVENDGQTYSADDPVDESEPF